ncbi:MAG: PH domain-containing protein [Pseudonocardiaceae bacterium]|nr:PH domain-containing protein [Pseudonocardiaceae bacterium]
MTDAAPARGWHRLDPRMLAVTPLRQLTGFLPVIVIFLIAGGTRLDGRFYGVLAAVVAVVIAGIARWFTTRYRVTEERVELRSGLLFRRRRSVPRDRIRTVDLTAGPVHRIFGLSVVNVGTGQRTEGTEAGELSLDAVAAAEADRLRQRLLERATDIPQPDADTPPDQEIARLDWSWLRFAPLTVSSLVAVGAVAGAGSQLAGDLGVDPSDIGELNGARQQLETAPLWLGVALFALLVLLVGLLGSVLLFIEAWWGYRLAREPGGTLRVRRGALTTRSISLEERRLRGVEVAEPLLLRAGGGARLTAVATGLGGAKAEGRGTLLPPAPVAEAHRVSAAVLAEQPAPTTIALRRHPPAARRRRLLRAVVPVAVLVALLWLLPVPGWLPWTAATLLPVAVLLALDAYRNLGHALAGRYLVTRHGAAVRSTAALQRSGVIGWTVSQSIFQRRSELVTLAATTAAGSGAYAVYDVGTADGLALGEQVVPGLLAPFLTTAAAGDEAPDQEVLPGHRPFTK